MFSFSLEPVENDLVDRTFPRTPFVPANKALRDERCEEILTLQATGLATRLRHTHAKTAVVGLSGGLDSTLALIVLVHAFDMLELDRKGILAVTMPCFGTTARTKGNAEKLAELRRYAQDRGHQGGSRSTFHGHRSVQGRSFRYL